MHFFLSFIISLYFLLSIYSALFNISLSKFFVQLHVNFVPSASLPVDFNLSLQALPIELILEFNILIQYFSANFVYEKTIFSSLQ